MMNNRPEISFLIQSVLPLLTEQFDFPRQENEEAVKIDQIPVQMGSGTKKPDVVYYHEGLPVALLEAKRPNKNLDKTLLQAVSYATLFPVSEYSNGLVKPKIIIISIGRELFWYRRWVDIKNDEDVVHVDKIEPLSYNQILSEYGLADTGQKRTLSAQEFRSELIGDLVAIYKTEDTITPEVVKNVASQILAWLKFGDDYSAHEPYISLDGQHERQAQLRGMYKNLNITGSLGPDAARAFRQFVLRAFQGQYNQYITNQSIIGFMYQLVGDVGPDTKVLDFECGSGGFLAAAVDTFDVKEENIRGIDVNPLPYLIATTYMAIFFKKTGKEAIDNIPVKLDNGLFNQGRDWDVVIGNPAGGSKYDVEEPHRADIDKVYDNLQRDLDNNGRDDSPSEYYFSVQQAVQSTKIGGKVCLILPEGLFANSRGEVLRKYISKYCKVLAIISLPRGVFRRGTTTRYQHDSSIRGGQKMSILLVKKNAQAVPGESLDAQPDLDYPVFLAQINENASRPGELDDWLDELLGAISKQWKNWQQTGELQDNQSVEFELPRQTAPNAQLDLEEPAEEQLIPQAPEPKIETTIDESLKDIFSQEP